MGVDRTMPYTRAIDGRKRRTAMSRPSMRALCIAGVLSAVLGAGVIAIEMPYRAEDAAIVPVTLRSKLSPDDSRRMLAITLVIDQNPAPMAARFELGPDANVREISTRVRVNNYTD